MLFGPDWVVTEPPKPAKKSSKPRKRPVVPDWIAEILACENCGRPRVGGKSGEYAGCVIPSCSKLWPASLVRERIESGRITEAESAPDTPDPARCLRLAWRYLRGRLRRKDDVS